MSAFCRSIPSRTVHSSMPFTSWPLLLRIASPIDWDISDFKMILSPTIPAILSAITFSCANAEETISSRVGKNRFLTIDQKYIGYNVKYPAKGVFNKTLECAFYFFFFICFDDIAYADIVVILDGKT